MARPRKDHVRESLQELTKLETRHRGTALESRIRVVRLMKERPSETIATIADAAGCSERSAHRWWQEYRREGMTGLLGERKGTRIGGTASIDNIAEALAQKLADEELSTLKEIQQWLADEYGASYTIKGVSNLLHDRLRVRRRWVFEDQESSGMLTSGTRQPAVSVNSSAPRVSEEVIRFVNELPTQGDPVTWIIQFRDALKRLLGDVDHIVMSVSADADVHRQRVKPVIRLTRNVNLGNGQGDEMHYTINREMSPSAIHLEDGIRAGFPIGKYHQPHLYDYYIGAEHMGSIILLRERTAKPISAETLTLMEELRPFFIFALSDCVARQHKGHTPERYFSDYFSDMVAKESKLTLREQEVLTLRLIGAKYSEIADRLCISIDTVRKHVKSIHAKTNTRTLADLLAYYFKSSKE